MPYPDDFQPPNLTGRSLNCCRNALQQHYGAAARQGADVNVNIDDVLVDNGPTIRTQGAAAWASIWGARTDATTPADAIKAWRQAMQDWTETNLIG